MLLCCYIVPYHKIYLFLYQIPGNDETLDVKHCQAHNIMSFTIECRLLLSFLHSMSLCQFSQINGVSHLGLLNIEAINIQGNKESVPLSCLLQVSTDLYIWSYFGTINCIHVHEQDWVHK